MQLEITPQQAKLEKARRAAHSSYRAFFRMNEPGPNYVYGRHTNALIDIFDRTVKRLEQGLSTYVIVNLPPRYGKSDQASRVGPPWALVRNPRMDIILASYAFSLASNLSFEARRLYKEVAPMFGSRLHEKKASLGGWKTDQGGGVNAVGLTGSIAGFGADLLIVDDYIKGRADAESKNIRDKVWNAFQSDLFPRLAPVHGVIIVANRWHQDDLVGRILQRCDPKHPNYDEDYPVYERVAFPEYDEETDTWLCEERWTPTFCKARRSTMGSYAWQSQCQQDPRPRTGNMLRADNVQFIDEMPEGLTWVRGWDLASSTKEVASDDPDYTVGTLAAVQRDPSAPGVFKIYVADVVKGRWKGTERNNKIIATAERDGPNVTQKVETVAGYTDAYDYVKNLLYGRFVVRQYKPSLDKVSRCVHMEPVFEAGNVYALRSGWNHEWQQTFLDFPNGVHDDDVDSLECATHGALLGGGSMGISR